jgi:hypothetical protein
MLNAYIIVGKPMSFEESLLLDKKDVSAAEVAQQQRRLYLLKSLMRYGFTEEQAELLLESVDEFVAEEKDLTEEAKESLYKE